MIATCLRKSDRLPTIAIGLHGKTTTRDSSTPGVEGNWQSGISQNFDPGQTPGRRDRETLVNPPILPGPDGEKEGEETSSSCRH
jgi:hypothetical protein